MRDNLHRQRVIDELAERKKLKEKQNQNPLLKIKHYEIIKKKPMPLNKKWLTKKTFKVYRKTDNHESIRTHKQLHYSNMEHAWLANDLFVDEELELEITVITRLT